MYWAREIDIEDLLDGDLELIYEHAGEDVLLALLDRLGGMHLYLNMKPVARMKRRYIAKHFGTLSAKQLAARLGCSEEFVYQTIRDANEDAAEQDAPTLFTPAGSD